MRALARVELVDTILAPGPLAGLFSIVLTLAIAWGIRKRQPLVTFSILAYWWLFALTSSIFPFMYVVTDYRQYLPLAFLCLTVTMTVFSFRRVLLPGIVLSSFVLYASTASYYINTHWETEESFWRQSVKYGATALGHNNYALAMAATDPDLAEHHYLEALRQSPFHIYANINVGLLYLFRQGKEDEGLQRLYDVVAWNPDRARAHHWLSFGLERTGRSEEAVEEAIVAADLDPRSLEYQYRAGRALQSAGRVPEAIPYLERTIQLNSNYKLAEFWLGFAYQRAGQSRNAIDVYGRFLKANPNHVQGRFNLAFELMVEDDCGTAVPHFMRVLELRPTYRETHLHLSTCYSVLGNEELATHHASTYRSEN